MNKYFLQQKIATLAKIDPDFSDINNPKAERLIDGILFRQWECSIGAGSVGDYWIAEAEIEEKDYKCAIECFYNKLDIICAKLSFVTQCSFEYHNCSSIVLRKNNNDENSFFFWRKNGDKGCSMSVGDDEVEDYNRLVSFPCMQFFIFFRESINTVNYYAKLVLLFAALESLSGEVERKTCSCPLGRIINGYDREKMKRILNDSELFDELYGRNGARHNITHGKSLGIGKDYCKIVYEKIRSYLKVEYSLNIEEDVINAPRTFGGTTKEMKIWLRCEKGLSDIKNVENAIVSEIYRPESEIGGYEVVRVIDNY